MQRRKKANIITVKGNKYCCLPVKLLLMADKQQHKPIKR